MGLTIACLAALAILMGFIHKLETTSPDDSEIEDLDLIERRGR